MRVNRHNASPAGLTIFSHVPVQFPKLCAKCGAATDKTISIKATAVKPGLKPTILLGHAGSILEAFQELRSGSVSIPCCPTCFRAFATGRKITIACLLCAPLLLFLIGKFSSSWPEWLMVLAGFICFTMFLGAFVPYLAGQVKAMPVDQDKLWDDLQKARNHIGEMVELINKSKIEICSWNFKYPLNSVDCVLVCTVDPHDEIIWIAGIGMP